MSSFSTTLVFDGKLKAIQLIDPKLAEAIKRECAFFAATAIPREGYDGPGMADIRNIRICGLHGDVLAKISALLRDGTVTFFEIPFMDMPKNDPYE